MGDTGALDCKGGCPPGDIGRAAEPTNDGFESTCIFKEVFPCSSSSESANLSSLFSPSMDRRVTSPPSEARENCACIGVFAGAIGVASAGFDFCL